MGAECAHFESAQPDYVKFCGRSPDFLLEVSGNGSESQMRFEPPELTSKANGPQRLTRYGPFDKSFGDKNY
jgi:hypothetical protein